MCTGGMILTAEPRNRWGKIVTVLLPVTSPT